ncbi:MAG: hypothetical protein J6B34_04815 [Clostridia bacterium]|nr:hypothetical protein [Clostridia bacterium]
MKRSRQDKGRYLGVFKNVLLSSREEEMLKRHSAYKKALKLLSCYKRFKGIYFCHSDFEVLKKWCARIEARDK